jgi:hypothetical protein
MVARDTHGSGCNVNEFISKKLIQVSNTI